MQMFDYSELLLSAVLTKLTQDNSDISVSKLHAELNIPSNYYMPARLTVHSPNGITLDSGKRVARGDSTDLPDGAIFKIAGRPFKYEKAKSPSELVVVEVCCSSTTTSDY